LRRSLEQLAPLRFVGDTCADHKRLLGGGNAGPMAGSRKKRVLARNKVVEVEND